MSSEEVVKKTDDVMDDDLSKYPEDIREKILKGREIEAELAKAAELVKSSQEPDDEQVNEQTNDSTAEGPKAVDSGADEPVESKEVKEVKSKDSKDSKSEPSEESGIEELKKERDEWRKRFVNFKKSADKTIHNLRTENKALSESVNILTAKVESLEEIAEKYNELQTQDLTTKMSEELGEDSTKVIDEYIRNVVEPLKSELDALKQENQQLKDLAFENLTATKTTSFVDRVRAAVPNFDMIDNDPRFLQYIEQVDPLSGKTIKDLIATAISQENLRYVVSEYQNFANLYYGTSNNSQVVNNTITNNNKPQSQEVINSSDTVANKSEKPEIDPAIQNRMSPVSSASSQNQPVNKKIWKADEVKQFYTDKVTGRIPPEEAEIIAKDIELAAVEGRIVA